MWKDIAYLINKKVDIEKAGDQFEEVTERMIFVNKKSIKQSEFYQAQATGLRPELTLECGYLEYNDEKNVKFNNKTYSVIRTYAKNEEVLELTLGGGINGNGS